MGENNLSKGEGAFNISLSSLERINLILTGCTVSSFKQDIWGWCMGITCLRKETRVFFNQGEAEKNNGKKEDDGTKTEGFEKKLDDYIAWWVKLTPDQKKDIIMIKSLAVKYLQMLKFLEEYENFLREVLHRKGLLLKMGKDASKAAIDL